MRKIVDHISGAHSKISGLMRWEIHLERATDIAGGIRVENLVGEAVCVDDDVLSAALMGGNEIGQSLTFHTAQAQRAVYGNIARRAVIVAAAVFIPAEALPVVGEAAVNINADGHKRTGIVIGIGSQAAGAVGVLTVKEAIRVDTGNKIDAPVAFLDQIVVFPENIQCFPGKRIDGLAVVSAAALIKNFALAVRTR